jgi:hypothetical protein
VAGSESGGVSTTPEFGWPLIEPTDFVTNLPADFEAFADAVDDDLKGLNGGTTGQVLTKDSATDLDFSWTTMVSGGLTQIATQDMAGLNTVTFSTIPTTYKYLVVQGLNLITSANQEFLMRFNSVTSSTYDRTYTRSNSATNSNSSNQTAWRIGDTGVTGAALAVFLTIPNYANANQIKGYHGFINNDANNFNEWQIGANSTDINGVVTSITLFAGASANFSAGTITLFGGN